MRIKSTDYTRTPRLEPRRQTPRQPTTCDLGLVVAGTIRSNGATEQAVV